MGNKLNKSKKFIITFLEALDLKNTPFKMFARESWHYKDLRMAGIDPDVIYQNVYNLKCRGLLKDVSPGRFKLTQSGSVWARGAISRYFPRRYPIWDKKWRLVIFDIPQELHLARIKFRKKLKNLGFFMLQKSVFVLPYPCHEEIGDICEQLDISDYVDIITAEDVGFKKLELIKYFTL